MFTVVSLGILAFATVGAVVGSTTAPTIPIRARKVTDSNAVNLRRRSDITIPLQDIYQGTDLQ